MRFKSKAQSSALALNLCTLLLPARSWKIFLCDFTLKLVGPLTDRVEHYTHAYRLLAVLHMNLFTSLGYLMALFYF